MADFLRTSCFINGRWDAGDQCAVIPVTDPATGETLGTVPDLGRAGADRAIDAAARALPDWRARTAQARGDFGRAIHDALLRHQDDLAHLLTREMGKPLAEAKGEVAYAAGFFRWFAEEARRVYGEVVPSPWPDKRILVTREPVGVVGAITPWNFPTAMIARKAAAALAAGCPIVIKPSELTPFSALAYGVIAEEVGLPPGVLNIVTGTPGPIGDAFCERPEMRKISFTGSTRVGRMLAAKAMATMTKVSMELGGNAPFIVFGDADLDSAVAGAVASKFRASGQTCVCANRFLVESSVYDAFCARLTEAVSALTVGPGLEDGVTIGPLINGAGVDKVLGHIKDALAHGGTVLTGGGPHALGGTFVEPTVIRDATPAMRSAREETFGPLAPIFCFGTEAEAIALANATESGLASYVYTSDLGRAWRLMEALDCGIVGINEGIISTPVAPFGGVKQSGVGREGGHEGIEEYLSVKYALVGGLG